MLYFTRQVSINVPLAEVTIPIIIASRIRVGSMGTAAQTFFPRSTSLWNVERDCPLAGISRGCVVLPHIRANHLGYTVQYTPSDENFGAFFVRTISYQYRCKSAPVTKSTCYKRMIIGLAFHMTFQSKPACKLVHIDRSERSHSSGLGS